MVAHALIGARSCGRCGTDLSARPEDKVCTACGARRLPAASGAALGTYAGLLAGVRAAAPWRRRSGVLIDLLPVVGLGAIAGVAALGTWGEATGPMVGVPVAALTCAVFYGILAAAALRRRGRSLGGLILRLRTVDDLTGEPPRTPAGPGGWGSAGRRHTVVADLRRGRDPLLPATAPLDAAALRPAPVGVATEYARAASAYRVALDQSPSVVLVLDTGERLSMESTLLIGRLPAGGGGEASHPVFAWPDLNRSLSKTHALLEWTGAVLWVTDLRSGNGSALVSPDGVVQPLVPGLRGPAAPGWSVRLGQRTIEVHPSGILAPELELSVRTRFVRGIIPTPGATEAGAAERTPDGR